MAGARHAHCACTNPLHFFFLSPSAFFFLGFSCGTSSSGIGRPCKVGRSHGRG